jgi:hypothetical protein
LTETAYAKELVGYLQLRNDPLEERLIWNSRAFTKTNAIQRATSMKHDGSIQEMQLSYLWKDLQGSTMTDAGLMQDRMLEQS